MALRCPVKSSSEWKALVRKIGYTQAISEFFKRGDIPNSEEFSRQPETMDELRKWFEDRFAGESFVTVKKLIDGKAYGQFYNGLVTLYEGATAGVGYHEAFHKVSQLYLTPTQRKRLYNEVRSKYKLMDDFNAEEHLAKDFRKYMENGGQSILGQPVRNSVFRRILRAIRNFVLGPDAQAVYEKLASKRGYSGDMRVNSPTGFKYYATSFYNESDTRAMLEDFTSVFFDHILVGNNLSPQGFLYSDSTTQKTLIDGAYKRIQDLYKADIVFYQKNAGKSTFDERIRKIESMLSHFDKAKRAHYDYLVQYGIKITASVDSNISEVREASVEEVQEYTENLPEQEEDGEDTNAVSDLEIGDDKNPFSTNNEINSIETLSKNTKLLIASTTEKEYAYGEVSDAISSLGRNKLVNFKKMYNQIAYTLRGLSEPQEMYDALVKLAGPENEYNEDNPPVNTNPSVWGIIDKLQDPSTIPDGDLDATMLWASFAKDFAKTLNEGSTTIVDPETGRIYQDANLRHNLRDKIKESWRTNLLTNKNYSKIDSTTGNLTLLPAAYSNDPISFLENIGIVFEGYTREEVERGLPAVVGDVSGFVSKLQGAIGTLEGPIDKIFEKGIEGNFKGNFDAIADFIGERTKHTIELSYRNAEGKRVYGITQHNYLSLIVDSLNNVSTLNEFKKRHPSVYNIYNQSSLWFNTLFEERDGVMVRTDKKISLVTVSGYKAEKANGKNTTSLHIVDKIVQEFNDLFKQGGVSLPRASDKSTEYAVRVDYGKNKLAIPIDKVNSDLPVDLLMRSFNDELSRIRSRRIDGIGTDIKVYSERSQTWSIFQDIFNEEERITLEASMNDRGVSPDTDMVRKAIGRYLKDLVNRETAVIKGLGIGRKTTIESYESGKKEYKDVLFGIDRDLTHGKDGKPIGGDIEAYGEALIKAFILNHLVETIEHHKVLIGDPALYRDKFKRISAFTGCLGYGTRVIKYDGTIEEVQNIKKGDLLMGPDDTPRTVLRTITGVDQMYWIRQNKGIDYRVNKDHILSLKKRLKYGYHTDLKGNKTRYEYNSDGEVLNVKVSDLVANPYLKSFLEKHKGYTTGAVNFDRGVLESITIDPYYLGLWLGDGMSDRPNRIASIDDTTILWLEEYADSLGLKLTTSGITHSITDGQFSNKKSCPNILLNMFREAGLIGNKMIPDNYLFADRSTRLSVLAGFIDSDGTLTKDAYPTFKIKQTRKNLHDQFALLARSCGFVVREKHVATKNDKWKDAYELTITGNNLHEIPTKLERKQYVKLDSDKYNDPHVTGISIEEDSVDNFYGFELDGDHLFLLEDFTVTHNSKDYVLGGVFTDWINKHREFEEEYSDSDILNVVVVKDVTTISTMMEEYSQHTNPERLGEYGKMTEADAQGLVDIILYRRMGIKTGDWTPAQEKQYQYEMAWGRRDAGKALTPVDIKILAEFERNGEFAVFPVKKSQYAGPQVYNKGDINVQAFHKYSLAPIFPRLVKGTHLESKLDQMRTAQVGYMVFDSGSKVGTKVGDDGSQHDFFKDTSFRPDHIQRIHTKYLGTQVQIAPKVKEKVIFGTQFRKLIESNLFDNGVASNPEFAELHEEYKSLISQLVEKEWSKLKNQLGVTEKDGEISLDKEKLASLIREEAISRNLSNNVIESVDVHRDASGKAVKTGGEAVLKYQIDSLVNRNKIENLLMSLVNSRVVRQKMPGDGMIQVATTGFTKKEYDNEGKLLTYRKGEDGKTLPAQVKVSLNAQYSVLLDIYGDLDGVNTAIREKKIDKRILTMVGYRIPTQGMNSIEHMEIVEFLPPSTMNSIILPSEIVAKSGGDFDIDKLNIFRPNFRVVGRLAYVNSEIERLNNLLKDDPSYEVRPKIKSESALDEVIEEGDNEEVISLVKKFKPTEVEYVSKGTGKSRVQNRIIEIAGEIISHPYNYELLITPNTVDTLKGIVKRIRDAKGMPVDAEGASQTRQLEFSYIMDQFKYFLGGKGGVGPAAIHNTFHTLFQQAGTTIPSTIMVEVKGKPPIFKKRVWMDAHEEGGRLLLGKTKSTEKQWISDTISQFINAYVDVAKDPFYKDLNAGMEVEGIYFYLIHMGVDIETIGYFLTQPSIMEYVESLAMNESLSRDAYGQTEARYEIREKIVGKYVDRLKDLGVTVNPDDDSWYRVVNDKDLLLAHMGRGYKNGELVDVGNIDDVDYLKDQLQAVMNFEQYKRDSDTLTKLTRTLNYDTNKPKDLSAIEEYARVVQEIEGSDLFNKEDRQRLLDSTIVGSFSKHKGVEEMYTPLFITETEEFKNARNLMVEKIAPDNKDRGMLKTLINNDFINYLAQTEYTTTDGSTLYDIIDRLFKGTPETATEEATLSVARKLVKMKEKLGGENYLIDQLQSMLTESTNDLDNISIFTKKYTVEESNSLTASFRELIDNPDPEVTTFARDLAKHGIIQSGLNNSPITYLGVIPHEVYGNIVERGIENWKGFNEEQRNTIYNDFFTRFLLKNADKPFVVPYAKRNADGDLLKSSMNHVALLEMIKGGPNHGQYYMRLKVDKKHRTFNEIPSLKGIVLRRYGYKLQDFYFDNMRIVPHLLGDITGDDSGGGDPFGGDTKTVTPSTPQAVSTPDVRTEITNRLGGVIKDSARKHLPKEQVKSRVATQYVGDGSKGSSTDGYRGLYEEYGIANTGRYTSEDVVWVSSNGKRSGRINPVANGELQGVYKNIDLAMQAGATLIMDTASHLANTGGYNIGEIALAEYVASKGYSRVGQTGEWIPSEVPFKTDTVGSTESYVLEKVDYTTSKSIFGGKKMTTAVEALEVISGLETEKVSAAMAKRLLDYGVRGIKMYLEDNDSMLEITKSASARGMYLDKSDTIALREDSVAKTIIHEVLHALSYKELQTDSVATQNLKRIYDHVKDMGSFTGKYGVSNIDEFMVAIFTDAKIISALQKQPPLSDTHVSLWQEIVDALASMLGKYFPNPEDRTLFSEAMDAAIGVLNSQNNDAPFDIPWYNDAQKLNNLYTEIKVRYKVSVEDYRKMVGGSKNSGMSFNQFKKALMDKLQNCG